MEFVKKNKKIPSLFQKENFVEFITFTTAYIGLTFIIVNFIDIMLDNVFKWMEQWFVVNKDSTVWLSFQILAQIMVSAAISFYMRYYISLLIFSFSSKDRTIFHPNVFGIMIAFIHFYGQDRLKTRLGELNKRIDSWFS